jgi:Na+/phosphate symporter
MESLEVDQSVPGSSPGTNLTGGLEVSLAPAARVPTTQVIRALWDRIGIGKVLLFAFSLYLFILAISLLKDGARGVAPLLQERLAITNTANSLGFGWLFAYVIMSGSPVAAAALAFFDAGALDPIGAFAMITGSRLGASFIVLFIGFLYVLRGRDRATSLSMGLLSLIVTATTYLPGLFVGAFILRTGLLDSVQFQSGALLQSVVDLVIEPVTGVILYLLPNWAVFLTGLCILIVSFQLFDKCLPQMAIKESRFGWMSRLIYRPWVMFLLGALITVISMSVSISLSILVPLSARGFVRRENVIPYIMGANISTFIDTLLAAVLLNNPPAFTIVLVEMVSITILSIFILVFFYGRYQRFVLDFVAWITASTNNLVFFMLIIFCLPIVLLLF